MYTIFKKELRYFFSNATGYIVIGLFLLVTGLFLWIIPGEYNVLDSGYAQVDGLFMLAPWLFLFLCPALTMRLFAEEKQSRTWDLLQTAPVKRYQIVLGKYLAGWILGIIALLPCSVYYFSVSYIAEPVGNIDGGAFWGAFIGLFFLVGINCAIGTFASSLTHNQITAFIIAMALCFICFYGFDLLSSFFTDGEIVANIQSLGFHAHYKSVSRGVIDSRDIIYFLSVSALFLLLTTWQVDRQQI